MKGSATGARSLSAAKLLLSFGALVIACAVACFPAFAASEGPFAASGARADAELGAAAGVERAYVYRLLVGFDGAADLRDGDVVLGSFGSTFLLGFDTASDLRAAQAHYCARAAFASIDGVLSVAGDASEEEVEEVESAPGLFDLTAATARDNPLAALGSLPAPPAGEGRLIALVDTGLDASRGVVRRASVLGGAPDDDNGHGSSMLAAIQAEHGDARVVSVKALDRFGKGSVCSVYAGIAYAIEAGADIVNLSFSGRASAGCAAIEAIISDAASRGIAVVAAAGNDGRDAASYCPANAAGAITIGACSPDGEPLASSNWGEVVDAYVNAPLTSYAAARASGWLSARGSAPDWRPSLFEGLAHLVVQDAYGEGGLSDPGDEEGFSAAASHATLTLTGKQLESDTMAVSLRSATCSTDAGSLGTSAQGPAAFESFGVRASGNGVSGNAFCDTNDASGWKTMFRMYLTGALASAYKVVYAVHGLQQEDNNGGPSEDGAWSSHNEAAIDGVYFFLETRKYQHDTYVRYQQDDGSWGGYALAASESYGYLDAVPAYVVPVDTRVYAAATRPSYVAGYAARNTYVDVSRASFTVSYAANGGWGVPPAQEKEPGCALLLSDIVPERSDESAGSFEVSLDAAGGSCSPTALFAARTTRYRFGGWNTQRDGTGASYGAGGSYALDASVTLYAQWDSSTETAEVVLPPATRPDYAFDGWYTSAQGGAMRAGAGDALVPEGPLSLYAHWTYAPSSIEVDFDANGGAGTMASLAVPRSERFAVPDSSFTRVGYRFAGWNADPRGEGAGYAAGQQVELDGAVTLYAQWAPLSLAFSAPGSISFSMRADGSLSGPSDESVFLENGGDAGLAVTGMAVAVADGFSVVDEAVGGFEYSFTMTPGEGDAVSLADYVGDAPVRPSVPDQWRIAAKSRLALNAFRGRCGQPAAAFEPGVEVASLSWRVAMPVVEIAYDVGEATGALPSHRVNAGVPFALPACPCERAGKEFAGWSTSPDGGGPLRAAGERVSFDGDVTLHAVWE